MKVFGADAILEITPKASNIEKILLNIKKSNKTADNKRARTKNDNEMDSDDDAGEQQRRGDTMGEILEESDSDDDAPKHHDAIATVHS